MSDQKPDHAFVPSDLPTLGGWGGCCHTCGLPHSAHPASPPEPHSVAVALESRSLERDTPVAERGRGLNHPKGQGCAVAGREVRREPDTRSASSREGGSIPPSDTISPPEPAPESEEPRLLRQMARMWTHRFGYAPPDQMASELEDLLESVVRECAEGCFGGSRPCGKDTLLRHWSLSPESAPESKP